LNHIARLLLIAGLMGLAACDQTEEPKAPEPAVTYTPVAFSNVPGWDTDNMAEALPAWRHSCRRILGFEPARELGPAAGTAGDWQDACQQITTLSDNDTAGLRDFLEANFVALHVTGPDDPQGLFTGYFEPILEAARTKSDDFAEPIYALPEDHVTVNLGTFDPALKGKAVVGRVEDRKLVPYRERGEIDAGAITDKAQTLFWARDPLDVFILQVQGSGIVALPDGTQQRIGFAGHNGHGYGSLGRWLIDQGELQPNRATWEDIRGWLESNPDRARAALAVNPVCR
jgi:membrane-bound lytic murein transglycosylase A